jgi:hypothetical protein
MATAKRPISFLVNETDADRDRIVLRAVLERGSCHASAFHETALPYVWGMVDVRGRSLLRTNDRLATCFELTAAGHRRLASVDPTYKAPPHGALEMERWDDPEALLCRVAYLLGPGKESIRRADPSVVMSEAAAAVVVGEQKRLAALPKETPS